MTLIVQYIATHAKFYKQQINYNKQLGIKRGNNCAVTYFPIWESWYVYTDVRLAWLYHITLKKLTALKRNKKNYQSISIH